MKTLYSAVFSCLLFASALQADIQTNDRQITPSAETTQQPTETFTNADSHYSIIYPASWKRNAVPGLDLVLFGPLDPVHNTHASMNIVSEKVGGGDLVGSVLFRERCQFVYSP